MRHIISLSIVLAAFWLFNSGHYSGLILSLGFLSILLVLFLAHRMDVIDEVTQPLLKMALHLPPYIFWLAKEVVVTNVMVTKHIWAGPASISPTEMTLTMTQTTDVGKVIYGNSITLTPGTVTLDIEGDKITVHALTRETMDDLATGDMDRRVSKLEK